MIVTRTVKELRERIEASAAPTVGFVPTMGALHPGHISLVEKARGECGTVVVSIFVNPTQFNDKADLDRYPRTPQQDLDLLERAGTDIVFVPDVREIYPEPDVRQFDFGTLDKVMEGPSRPGHFNGVAQVVSRLFEIVRPQRAYFGEKDFQQVAVIRELVRQTESPVEIIACPTVREADGLAMSSRNTLLDEDHRRAAPAIFAALSDGLRQMGSMTPAQVTRMVTGSINSNPLLEVIYFEIVDGMTLRKVSAWDEAETVQGCIAVQAGNVRLIDNIRFK